jgi:hypothetical protein
MDFTRSMAGLGGRNRVVGFISSLATANVKREPGKEVMALVTRIRLLAGLGGRSIKVGFTTAMATANGGKSEPGSCNVDFTL